MSSKFDNETNEQFLDEYCDQDEDDLGDFIVYSDDDDESLKHRQHQQELEDEHQQEDEMEQPQEDGNGMEEEVEEEVEVEEEEEAPVGQQEILSLREQLKEEIRRKNAAMVPSAHKPDLPSSSKSQTMPPVNDGYGTFFGPSQPVLARRVIEEGCSSSMMKDLHNVPSSGKDVSKMRPGAVQDMQKRKFVSEEKRKVDTLRKNRDYSCLFSDDADTHPPTKDHPNSRAPLAPKSETQDGVPVKSARKSIGQPASLSLGKKAHAERKGTIAAGRNGSSLPNNLKKKSPGLLSSSKSHELQPSLHNKRLQASIPSQTLRQQSQSRQRPQGNGRQPPLQGRSLQGQLIGQNRSAAQNARLKSAQKQLIQSSKFKASHGVEKHTVKRRKSSDDRQIMHNYDKFAGSDEDESDMEADFASIQREERRSAALARREDEEQLRLIKEEERRERAIKRKRAAQKERS